MNQNNNELVDEIFVKLLDNYDSLLNSQFPKSELTALLTFHKELIVTYAEKKNPNALCLLASIIYDPDLLGVNNQLKYNLHNAYDFMLQSAQSASASARFALSELSSFYRSGVGVPINPEASFQYANQAVELQSRFNKPNFLARALRLRGTLYYHGTGTKQDSMKA